MATICRELEMLKSKQILSGKGAREKMKVPIRYIPLLNEAVFYKPSKSFCWVFFTAWRSFQGLKLGLLHENKLVSY